VQKAISPMWGFIAAESVGFAAEFSISSFLNRIERI
jgi:hypothetical protein